MVKKKAYFIFKAFIVQVNHCCRIKICSQRYVHKDMFTVYILNPLLPKPKPLWMMYQRGG